MVLRGLSRLLNRPRLQRHAGVENEGGGPVTGARSPRLHPTRFCVLSRFAGDFGNGTDARSRGSYGHTLWLLCCAVGILTCRQADAQQLRFTSEHRDIEVPSYATGRIGPFYSTVKFTQSVEFRYSASGTNAVDVLVGRRRGQIREDGFDIPLTSTLSFQNYLPISPNADLDASFSVRYCYFPLKTEENVFEFNAPDQAVSANLNAEFRPDPAVKVRLSDRPAYRWEYVDLRGRLDPYGGRLYERFENTAGVDADWLMQRDLNLSAGITRSDVRPRSDEFSFAESVVHNAAIGVEHEVNPLLVVGVRANFGVGDYPNRPQGKYSGQTYSLFANAMPVSEVTCSASLGYSLASLSGNGDPAVADTDSATAVGTFSLKGECMKGVTDAISYSRAQSVGFESGIDIRDTVMFTHTWVGDAVSVKFETAADFVRTVGWSVSGFNDWRTEIGVSLPVSSEVTVGIRSIYDVRNNGWVLAGKPEDLVPELVVDYTTWINRIETSYSLTRAVSAGAYVEYMVRDSVESSLDYGRFVAGLGFSYTHEF